MPQVAFLAESLKNYSKERERTPFKMQLANKTTEKKLNKTSGNIAKMQESFENHYTESQKGSQEWR